MKLKKYLSILLIISIISSLVGCGDGYRKNMSFTYVLSRNVTSLDPQTAIGFANSTVISSIFEGLCRIDENGKTVPGVARKWEANDDNTQFTFWLRSNAMWQERTPVTAYDFQFGIQRALSAETNTSDIRPLLIIKNAQSVYEGLADPDMLGVSVIDDKTLVFTLSEPCPDFPSITANQLYMPCNQEFFESTGGRYGLGSRFLITNGPFTFTSIYSWTPDQFISLSRAKNYRGQNEALPSSLTYRMFYTPKMADDPLRAIETGDLDIMPLYGSEIESARTRKCTIVEIDDVVSGLLLNPNYSALSSSAVREVLIKTIERDFILSALPEETIEAPGIMPLCVMQGGLPYYQVNDPLFTTQDDSVIYNIPSIIQSLSLPKFPPITILCGNDEDSIRLANQFIISWNRKIGVSFNIEPVEPSELASRIASGNYQAALYDLKAGGSRGYDVLSQFSSNTSTQLMSFEWFDDGLDRLIFHSELNREYEERLENLYIFYPIYYGKSYFAQSPIVTDIFISPDTGIDFTNARKRS